MTRPAGYDEVVVGRTRAIVWHGVRGWARRTLEAHGTLDAWASHTADARRLSGRGTVWSVPAGGPGPEGRGRWVVRRYLRGGAMASLLHDTYLRAGPTRPFHELSASALARARGVPVPAVIAGVVHPAGPFTYRAELVTEMVPDATDLAGVLFVPPEPAEDTDRTPTEGAPIDGAAALLAAGKLAREAGTAGVLHPDLNAKNVVLRRGSGGEPEAWMVDLDRCRIRSAPRPDADTGAMLARLERSLRKFERTGGRQLVDAEWTALRMGAAGREPAEGDDARDGASEARP